MNKNPNSAARENEPEDIHNNNFINGNTGH